MKQKVWLQFTRHAKAMAFARWLSRREDVARIEVFVNSAKGTSTVVGYANA